MFKNKEKIKDWLMLMEIEGYTINEDLTVDVNRDVNISNKNLTEIPIKFNVINGNFDCSKNMLSTMKNFPCKINGSLYANQNLLENCKGCPLVSEDLFIYDNKITNLKGCPQEIMGDFDCSENNLDSLRYGPKIIKGSLNISYNKIKTLKHFPLLVGLNISIKNCEIENLEYLPEKINGYLNLSKNKIKTLKYIPKKIEDYLDISENNLSSIRELSYINSRTGTVIYSDNPTMDIPCFSQIREVINYYKTIDMKDSLEKRLEKKEINYNKKLKL